MNARSKRSGTNPAARLRKVELLANTVYSVERESQEEVVLRSGKSLELWRQAKVPQKGYALLIGGHEYEFDSTLPE